MEATRILEGRAGSRASAVCPGIVPVCISFGGAFIMARARGAAVAEPCALLAAIVWGTALLASRRRRGRRVRDLLIVAALLLLGYGLGAPRTPLWEPPLGVPAVPMRGTLQSGWGRPVARRLEIAREGRWRALEGAFLARGVDALGDGSFVGRGWIVPSREPRLPGLSDPAWRQRISGLRGWIDVEEGWPVGARTNVWRSRAQARLRERVGQSLTPAFRSLIPMLVWGESGETDPGILRVFRATGTMHLVAISGLHVSLIALLVEFALRLVVRRAAVRVVLSLAGLAGYTALVGAMPSVVRSAIMAGCILVGRAIGRPGGMGAAWWTALLVVVVATPGEVASPGMQLSFGATAALLLRPRLPRRWDPIGSSFAATAATTGILWAHFGETAPLSVVANLIGIPAFTPVLISILWGLAWGDPANATLQAIAWGPTRMFAECWMRPLAIMCPAGEATIVRMSPGPVAGLMASVLFLGLLALARRVAGPGRAAALMVGMGVSFLFVAGSAPSWIAARASRGVEAMVLPVGQGDATLVRASTGSAYLIDTGPGGADGSRGRRALAPALRSLGVRRLRGVFITHGDEDHIGGLRGLLLAGIRVDTLYVSATAGTRRALPRSRFPPVRALRSGWTRTQEDLHLAVLWPPSGRSVFTGNDGSLVVRVEAPGGNLLLPGDLGHAAEESLAASSGFAEAQALLAGHHGSAGSSRQTWCARVRPRLALVSCGARNRHGHPAPVTVARLAAVGAAVHRTDREGTLALRWRGGRLWFRSGGCGAWEPVL